METPPQLSSEHSRQVELLVGVATSAAAVVAGL